MAETALWPLQKAIFQRLENNIALNERVNGVFDEVEKDTPKPYCTVGEPTVTPFETKSSFGENIVIVLHCWSDYNGKKEAYEILNLMLQALSASLSIEGGFTLFDFKIEQLQVITDLDGYTKHGILRVRFHINN